MPERNLERVRPMQELLFSTLEVGDIIVMKTKSGSDYRFSVHHNEREILVTIERESDHDVKEYSTAKLKEVKTSTVFTLRGSCKKVIIYDGKPTAINTIEGCFKVGERACVSSKEDGKNKTLVTSPIEAIQLKKPAGQE